MIKSLEMQQVFGPHDVLKSDINVSGIDTLITNCPFCVLSFERVLEMKEEKGEKMGFKIIDFYELFSEAYGNFQHTLTLR